MTDICCNEIFCVSHDDGDCTYGGAGVDMVFTSEREFGVLRCTHFKMKEKVK